MATFHRFLATLATVKINLTTEVSSIRDFLNFDSGAAAKGQWKVAIAFCCFGAAKSWQQKQQEEWFYFRRNDHGKFRKKLKTIFILFPWFSPRHFQKCRKKSFSKPKLRIELRTSSLQDWCSTSKLFGLGFLMTFVTNYLNILVSEFCTYFRRGKKCEFHTGTAETSNSRTHTEIQ